MTNADRIRQMTDDEELLSAIGMSCYRCVYNDSYRCVYNDSECSAEQGQGCAVGNLKWLKQEVSEDAAD